MERIRQQQGEANDSSRTIVIHDAAPREQAIDDQDNDGRLNPAPTLVLRLQGGPATQKKKGQRVVWKEDVVDNEGCGKKSTKICCIYHKPRKFDESSDESSDGSDCEDHDHSQGSSTRDPSNTTTIKSHSESNAYEALPHSGKPKPS